MSVRMPRVLGIVRFFADPDAVVDAAAEVLGELAVEVPADGAAVLVAVDDGFGLERLGDTGFGSHADQECHESRLGKTHCRTSTIHRCRTPPEV